MCLKLAKKGWCGGNPEQVGNMPTDWAIKMLNYENFLSDYEVEFEKLNNETR